MKKTTRIASFLLALVMVFCLAAVPADAKTIKYKDTKTAKKQAVTMTKAMDNAIGQYFLTYMKYKQTKKVDFKKAYERNRITEGMVLDDVDSSIWCRRIFGPTGKKNLNDETTLGTSNAFFKNMKVTRSGKYYTVKCTVYLNDVYEVKGVEHHKNVKLGYATLTYKLHAKTHYGLLLKKATFKRVAKAKYIK